MRLRFYINPQTGQPHIHDHNVDEDEVADVLDAPIETIPGRDGSTISFGQTAAGRWLKVIYVIEERASRSYRVITAYEPRPKAIRALRRRREK